MYAEMHRYVNVGERYVASTVYVTTFYFDFLND